MQAIFDRFMSDEKGNAMLDWAVLAAGALLMVTSVTLTVTGQSDGVAETAPVQVSGEVLPG